MSGAQHRRQRLHRARLEAHILDMMDLDFHHPDPSTCVHQSEAHRLIHRFIPLYHGKSRRLRYVRAIYHFVYDERI